MSKVNYLTLIVFTVLTFSGCDDDKHQTSHPDEGGIMLTIDWPKSESSTLPVSYQASVIYSSGESRIFDNLSGTTNNLVVDPGKATIYVYNKAENVSIFGKKATISNSGAGIAPMPDLFYSYSGEISTERDRDIPLTATMSRQTGELKLSFAIKPAAMIDKVKSISAVLDGVASELDMQTNELSTSSAINTTFSKSSYYATSTLRLFGFITSAKQNLKLDIEFENGRTASVSSDISSFVNGFNTSKNTLFALNASMYIDENTAAVTIDNWERNTESRYLSAFPSELTLPHQGSREYIAVTTDQSSWGISVRNAGNWLTVNETGNRIEISTTENTNQESRQAIINVSAGGLSESITVTQHGYMSQSYQDKEVVKLQSATVGKGINIIMMGDGYTVEEMAKETGKYERDMREATEHFFSVYPFTVYRNHFNVYMIAAISEEAGLSNRLADTYLNTKFESVWDGRTTEVVSNESIVIDYVNAITELSNVELYDLTVIIPINADIYAGTCLMSLPDTDPMEKGYGEGFSMNMCPVGRYFEEIIIHEACGHGFAKLADEYTNIFPKEAIPDNSKNNVNYRKEYGWFENIDFFSDIMQTSWRGFANNSKYHMVSTFEGGYTYGKGVWRPEFNSCMNDNIPYFNAPSRWAQVRRIKKLAGFSYSFSQFLQDDIVPDYPANTRSKVEKFIPLAPPVIIGNISR